MRCQVQIARQLFAIPIQKQGIQSLPISRVRNYGAQLTSCYTSDVCILRSTGYNAA